MTNGLAGKNGQSEGLYIVEVGNISAQTYPTHLLKGLNFKHGWGCIGQIFVGSLSQREWEEEA